MHAVQEIHHEIKCMMKYKYIILYLVFCDKKIFKGFIIHILFTPEFLPMKPLFTFQLIGDFFKIGSWLLAYLMIAKAMTKTFIITEIIFAASYVALSYYFMNHYGIIGATYSFSINYGAYWILMWFLMRKKIR